MRRDVSHPLRPAVTRRQVLGIARALGLTAIAGALPGALTGCAQPDFDDTGDDPLYEWPDEGIDLAAVAANIEAAMDVILPAEFNDRGELVSPGAVEAGAWTVMQLDRLVPLARAQGLLPELPDWIDEDSAALDATTQALISSELDRMAADYALLTPFRDLPRAHQEAAVADAFVDPDRAPLMELLRGVCFLAFLGAVVSDVGLQDLGYPPFEDFDDGLAVSGYPRIDADGEVDDYTYNLEPQPSPEDDLSGVLDASGDLI